MAEEEKIEEKGVDVQKYIDQIKEMQEKMVPKELLDEAKEENQKLLRSLVEGKKQEEDEEEEQKPTIEELRKKAFGPGCENLTDLEYVKTICDLRDLVKEETGIDAFVPEGRKYSPDANDIFCAEKVYNGFRHCLEVADGDNAIFMNEMSRITKDGLPLRR